MVTITQLTRRNESAGDYAFTLSMVGGMVFAALWANLI